MLLVVGVARQSTTPEFGKFAIWQAGFLLIVGVGRGLFGQVLSIVYPQRGVISDGDVVRAVRAALVFGLSAASLAGLIAVATEGQPFVLLLVGFAPVVIAHDTCRLAVFANGRGFSALRSDLLWLLIQTVTLVVALELGLNGAEWPVLSWGLGGIAAMLTLVPARSILELFPGGLVGWLRREWGDASRLVVFMLASEGQRIASTLAISATLGSQALGWFRGAQTLLAPVVVISQGVLIAVVPLAVRRRAEGGDVARLAVLTGCSLAALALAFGFVSATVPAWLGTEILGLTWDGSRDFVVMVGVLTAAQVIVSGAHVGLAAIARLDLLMRVRLLSAVCVAVPLGVGGAIGDLRDALALGSIGAVCASGVGWLAWRVANSANPGELAILPLEPEEGT